MANLGLLEISGESSNRFYTLEEIIAAQLDKPN